MALAKHFSLPHLDTGLLYRAVGRQVEINNDDPESSGDALKACDFPAELLANPILRTEKVGGLASRVSVHPAVRQALFERQRAFATQEGGAVLDGRDIGTVIAPEAEAKLFITASRDVRAARRHAEMLERGNEVTLDYMIEELARRDDRDMNRADAPLKPAEDAQVLDTTALSKDQSIQAAIEAVETLLSG